MNKTLRALTTCAIAVLITACGGGGDDPPTAATSAPGTLETAQRVRGVDPSGVLMRRAFEGRGPLVSLDSVRNASRRHARRYFISDLGSLGGTESFAHALNDNAQVVGLSRIAGDVTTHKFLYSDGLMRDLFPLDSERIQTGSPTGINNFGVVASGVVSAGVYVPALMDTTGNSISVLPCLGGMTSDGLSGVATAVNNHGVAVGYCYVNESSRHAFIYSNDVTTDIDAFGGDSAAIDVNDDGVATGFVSRQPAGTATAFIYRQGTMSEIFPVGTESYGRGINSRGQVVGEYLTTDGRGFRGYMYTDGTVTDIGSSDSQDTVPMALNDSGQVVGSKALTFQSTCSFGPCTISKRFAFLWEAGEMLLLDALIPRHGNWELRWAFDINNHGQIVGYGEREGRFRAFLMTPVSGPGQCRDGGWQRFGFSNSGKCIQFVNTGF